MLADRTTMCKFNVPRIPNIQRNRLLSLDEQLVTLADRGECQRFRVDFLGGMPSECMHAIQGFRSRRIDGHRREDEIAHRVEHIPVRI